MKKFLHLADLHIGRKLGDYPLLEDQKQVLQQAVKIAETCDEVLIAGDIYDKSNPSTEAMAVFDDFLTKLYELNKPVHMISGNHDAFGRISYFGKILEKNQITVPVSFTGTLHAVNSPDDEIQIYLLPFITPIRVKAIYKDEKIESYQDAVEIVLKHSEISQDKINLLVAHQFITGGTKSDEEFSVGGLDNINASVFDIFDYVALGHLHKPQQCSRETIRYAGSPLKYSLSEEHQKKSFTVIEIHDKNNININLIPVELPHDVRTIKGNFQELFAMPRTEDYVFIILTDENPEPDARVILRNNFPNMIQFQIENSKMQISEPVFVTESLEQKSPLDMLSAFYPDMTDTQKQIAREIFEELQEEEF
ncbi:MAG: exonuclease SbcCD subunit D [Oscillospiraceae bacterium]|nr:exonuclease SbcCD subunit D [Oscillospiraceae bacterium]